MQAPSDRGQVAGLRALARRSVGWEKSLMSCFFLLQGVPGHNGLPGQPGLTAELVGISQDTLAIALLSFLGTSWPCNPVSSGGGGGVLLHSASRGRMLLQAVQASPPSQLAPRLSLAGILTH